MLDASPNIQKDHHSRSCVNSKELHRGAGQDVGEEEVEVILGGLSCCELKFQMEAWASYSCQHAAVTLVLRRTCQFLSA